MDERTLYQIGLILWAIAALASAKEIPENPSLWYKLMGFLALLFWFDLASKYLF
jgi:hypothetical protein